MMQLFCKPIVIRRYRSPESRVFYQIQLLPIFGHIHQALIPPAVSTEVRILVGQLWISRMRRQSKQCRSPCGLYR